MKFNISSLPKLILFCCFFSHAAIAQSTHSTVFFSSSGLREEAAPNILVFMQNLAKCDQLRDKAMTYRTSPTTTIRIYSSASSFCVVENTDSAKPPGTQNQICHLTKNQISGMTSPEAFKIIDEFDKTQSNPNALKELFRPLTHCLDPRSQEAAPPQLQAPIPPPSESTPEHYDYGKMIH